MARAVSPGNSSGHEAHRQNNEPAQGTAAASFPIAFDSGQAGRRNLGNKRNALGYVLFGAQQQNGKDDQTTT